MVPLPIVVRRQRNWWLIGASCFVIALLLSAAILGVIQQRNDADRWQSDYQAEATRYRVAEGKDVAIYAALVLSQEKLAAATTKNNDTPTSDNQTLAIVRREAGSIADELKLCTNDTATVISEIQDSLRAGFIDPSLDSNATDAGAVCREAQSETSSLQVAVSAG